MIVVANQNINSLKYGEVLDGTEIEIEDKIAESWIKQGLAYGKDEVHDKGEGDTEAKGKAKSGKPKSNT